MTDLKKKLKAQGFTPEEIKPILDAVAIFEHKLKQAILQVRLRKFPSGGYQVNYGLPKPDYSDFDKKRKEGIILAGHLLGKSDTS